MIGTIIGIEYRMLCRRFQRGWDLKTALTESRCDSDTAVSDHLGNVFPSLVAMCQAYGININTYLYRIKAGWDKEEALIIPPLFDSAGGAKETLDHLGNAYSSLTEMCKAYGISVGLYRVSQGTFLLTHFASTYLLIWHVLQK